jgi:hypothetical protein
VIRYDAEKLKEIFSTDFQREQAKYDCGDFSGLNKLRHFSVTPAVEKYLILATDEKWQREDLETEEEKLRKSNREYRVFVLTLNGSGYSKFNDIELGTLWIIKEIMRMDLLIVGMPETFDKVPTIIIESYLDQIEYEKGRASRKNNKNGSSDPVRSGPKENKWHTTYQEWIERLLPWLLRSNHAIKDTKHALTLIGLLLHLAGFKEFMARSYLLKPTKEIKTGGKFGGLKDVEQTFTEFLYNRMKTILGKSLAEPVLIKDFAAQYNKLIVGTPRHKRKTK